MEQRYHWFMGCICVEKLMVFVFSIHSGVEFSINLVKSKEI